MLLQVAVRWLDTVSVESSQRIENTMLIIIYIGIVGMFFLDSRQMIFEYTCDNQNYNNV
jgi:hypothetical protein